MLARLETALRTLLTEGLPGYFGGAQPRVRLAIKAGRLEIDPHSSDAAASEPKPDDRIDLLPLAAANPAGPHRLSQVPYPGPRRVSLRSADGELAPLRPAEVQWDAVDPQIFRLALRPDRVVPAGAGLHVLYGVVAVFTRVKGTQIVVLELTGADADDVDAAEALLVAALSLNRSQLLAAAKETSTDGDYTATVEVKTLRLASGVSGTAGGRALELRAEVELKATRAVTEREGQRIERVDTRILLD